MVHRNDRTVIAEKKPMIRGTLLWSPPGGGGPSGFAMIVANRYDGLWYNRVVNIALKILIVLRKTVLSKVDGLINQELCLRSSLDCWCLRVKACQLLHITGRNLTQPNASVEGIGTHVHGNRVVIVGTVSTAIGEAVREFSAVP